MCGEWSNHLATSGNSDVYLIRTDASDSSGCNETKITTTDSVPVIITPVSLLSMTLGGTTLSPVFPATNLDSANTLCSNVGITEYNLSASSTLFPNPFTTTATIKFPGTLH